LTSCLAALATTAVWALAVASPAVAASTLGIDKTASTVTALPGTDFRYTIVPRCSGLTESCVNATVVDVLPPELEVTALPPSTSDRTVSYDAATPSADDRLPDPADPAQSAWVAGASGRVLEQR